MLPVGGFLELEFAQGKFANLKEVLTHLQLTFLQISVFYSMLTLGGNEVVWTFEANVLTN